MFLLEGVDIQEMYPNKSAVNAVKCNSFVVGPKDKATDVCYQRRCCFYSQSNR